MPWILLTIAGLLEVAWAIGLKLSNGFARPWVTVITVVLMLASFLVLAQALRTIPVGTGYAVWTGIGAAGTALVGMMFLHESRDWPRLLCLMLVVAGVVGLKFVSKE